MSFIFEVYPVPKEGRDARDIDHFGTGEFEPIIKSGSDFEETRFLIDEACKNAGG
jgi:hypothetical protein